jgi:pyruvate/2-oxoglutarate dehydrogenase complex dihydrolipoamide dehydrogenase (E3) component
MVGLEVSWLLASGGRRVTLIEKEESIGQGMEPISSLSLVREVLAMGTRILVGAVIEGCDSSSMAVVTGGRRVDVPFDIVVDATGRRPRRELLGEGTWRGDLVLVGDCVAPRNVYHAVHEGYAAGCCL